MRTQSARGTSKLVACALYFGILGPYVGFVVFWITFAVGPGRASLSDVLLAAGFGAVHSVALFPLALPIGGPPALLTGFIYFAGRRRATAVQGRILAVTLAIAAGASVSAMWGAAVFEGALSMPSEASYWRIFAVSGAVGGLVCALTADRFVFSSNGSTRATVA